MAARKWASRDVQRPRQQAPEGVGWSPCVWNSIKEMGTGTGASSTYPNFSLIIRITQDDGVGVCLLNIQRTGSLPRNSDSGSLGYEFLYF